MVEPAWRRVREILGPNPTFRKLMPLGESRLTELAVAAHADLYERGPKEAYARAWRDGDATVEEPCDYFGSVRVFLYACPMVIELARSLSSLDDGQPASTDPSDALQEFLWQARDELRDLGALPNVNIDDRDPWGFTAVTDISPDIPYVHFPTPGDATWLSQEQVAQECTASRSWDPPSTFEETDGLDPIVRVAWQAASENVSIDPYSLLDALAHELLEPAFSVYAWRVLEAAPAPGLADSFRRVACRDFGDAPPSTWSGATTAVECLVEDRLFSEAIALLDKINPDDFEHEILEESPDIPDEYDESWGSVGDWNSMVEEWNATFEGTKQTRRLWVLTARVEALQGIGAVDRALECVKSFNDPLWSLPVDAHIRTKWERLVAYFEGFEAGRTAPAGMQTHDLSGVDDIRESLRRIERQQYLERDRSNRTHSIISTVAEDVKTQGDLLLDMPQQVSATMKQDWMAYEEFDRHRNALLRGWQATATAEARESVATTARELAGTEAWVFLDSESRDDLLAAQHIKDTWGREHYALVSVGWCRAFERELRSALRRSGIRPAADFDGVSFGQLLYIASQTPADGTLHRVSIRADKSGLNGLRNDAAHASPSGFFLDKFRRLRSVLFRHGVDDQGLFAAVVLSCREPAANQLEAKAE